MSVASQSSFSPTLRAGALGLLTCVVCLAFVVYQAMANPAQGGWLVFSAPLVCLGTMMAMLAHFGFKFTSVDSLGWFAAASFFGLFAVCMLVTHHTMVVAGSQLILAQARENVEGRTPPLALEASKQLRARPLAIRPAMETLRPAVFGSANPDEVALFQAAHRAGVRSEVVDRVVANGFVTHGDKQSLLESLLAAHTEDNSEMKGLIALVASGR